MNLSQNPLNDYRNNYALNCSTDNLTFTNFPKVLFCALLKRKGADVASFLRKYSLENNILPEIGR